MPVPGEFGRLPTSKAENLITDFRTLFHRKSEHSNLGIYKSSFCLGIHSERSQGAYAGAEGDEVCLAVARIGHSSVAGN